METETQEGRGEDSPLLLYKTCQLSLLVSHQIWWVSRQLQTAEVTPRESSETPEYSLNTQHKCAHKYCNLIPVWKHALHERRHLLKTLKNAGSLFFLYWEVLKFTNTKGWIGHGRRMANEHNPMATFAVKFGTNVV